MKQQRHKREETFSLIMASNTGGKCRNFSVSARTVRALAVVAAIVAVALVWIFVRCVSGYGTESELRRRLAMSEQRVKQLEDEKDSLNDKNAALVSENETLKASEDSGQGEVRRDTAVPSQYPYTGEGMLKEQYSEEHPYISVGTKPDDRIVAGGAGTVVSVGSDDTYPVIVEVEHGNGYKSRYMCMKAAEVQVSAGQQIEARETLIVIKNEEMQLDYQIMYNEQAIDPLLVLEAKG